MTPANENSTEKTWVKWAVERSIERNTNVDFTGWGTCEGDEDIKVDVASYYPPAAAVGTSLCFPNGADMQLSFFIGNRNTPRYRDPSLDDCWTESELGLQPTWGQTGTRYFPTNRQRCIEVIAVHEFLHSLGLRHEQDSLLNDSSCDATGIEPPGSTFGYFDFVSASGYCNPVYRSEGYRSPLDVSGLGMLYGLPADDQIWYGMGHVRDFAGASEGRLHVSHDLLRHLRRVCAFRR